jgi:hypothetical protein
MLRVRIALLEKTTKIFKGQSHQKAGEFRVWGDSLGRYVFGNLSGRRCTSIMFKFCILKPVLILKDLAFHRIPN